MSLPVVVSFVHSVPGTYGLASIDIVDRGVGVSATSTRGSGVLSMMMSGANIEIRDLRSYRSLALGESLTSLMTEHAHSRNVDLYM